MVRQFVLERIAYDDGDLRAIIVRLRGELDALESAVA